MSQSIGKLSNFKTNASKRNFVKVHGLMEALLSRHHGAYKNISITRVLVGINGNRAGMSYIIYPLNFYQIRFIQTKPVLQQEKR